MGHRHLSHRLAGRATLGLAFALGLLLASRGARAEVGLSVHVEGALARVLSHPKSDQLGWGGAGLVALDVGFGRVVALDLPVGFVGLSSRDQQPPSLARTESATGVFTTPGLRLFPLAPLDGRWGRALWIAGGGGVALTGGVPYPALGLRAGFDVPLGRFAIGPHAGFLQIIAPGGGLHEDARIVTAGLHGALDFLPSARLGGAFGRDDVGQVAAPPAPEPDHDGFPMAVDRGPEAVPAAAPPPPAPPVVANPGDVRIGYSIGEVNVPEESFPNLILVAAYLGTHPDAEVRIAGHADDSGSAPDNLALSAQRARDVARSLVALGIEERRVHVAFYGSTRPLRHGTWPALRRQNRRVEMALTPGREVGR
jgi:hypothetical protein